MKNSLTLVAKAMSEKDLQDNVCELVDLLHGKWWHFSDSRRAGPGGMLVGDVKARGFPDLVIAMRIVLFVELKSHVGTVKPHQWESLRALRRAGQPVYIWRPMHWLNGDIEKVLRAAA